jgi:hypothetical protein
MMKTPDKIISGFKWSAKGINLKDPRMDSRSIGRLLMGPCGYWRDLPPRMTPLKAEIAILRGAGWKNWSGKSDHGKPYYQHLLTLVKLMMPKTDIHPALADAANLFCQVLGNGLKGMHMIGSQNSSKSATSVRLAFAVMAIFPEESAVYFANPFDSASDSTIWGEVEECYEEIIKNCPGLFPKSVKYALRRIDLVPGVPKAGTMEIRNVKHVGKLKGSKTKKTGEVQGPIVVVIDECNEIYNQAFIRVFANLVSQEGFIVQTSQNFKDPTDMGGRMTEPSNKFGGPGSFKDLSEEDDHIWYSYGSTMTIRFSGKNSPNILAGRTIYDYLFTKDNHEFLIENYGDRSPEYFSQCLSFPTESEESASVLSRSRINLSRHDDKFYHIKSRSTRVAFCDPSFGGGDLAAYAFADICRIVYQDAHSISHECDAIVFTRGIEKLTVSRDATVTPDILRRISEVGADPSRFKEGGPFPPEYQIALQCAEKNRLNGVERSNFGYDFSMRPDMVTAMGMLAGHNCVAFDYNTKPVGYMLKSLMQGTEDACRMRSDELAFLVSDIFANQRIRTEGLIPAAILQTSRTRYEIRNGKRMIEKKKEFKSRWSNESPDDRDCLFGIVGMCYMRGFRVVSLEEQARSDSSGRSLVRLATVNHSKFKPKKGKRLKF